MGQALANGAHLAGAQGADGLSGGEGYSLKTPAEGTRVHLISTHFKTHQISPSGPYSQSHSEPLHSHHHGSSARVRIAWRSFT